MSSYRTLFQLDTPLEETSWQPWILSGLKPAPEEEWERLQHFLNLGRDERQAMLATLEPLFRRGHELVVANYDYLLQNHETAAILGWEQGADPEHLAERRRFFTLWLARTIGLDMSHDFARYLFRAGQMHAGHGPRHVQVPEIYITGAISLVNAAFARFLAEEMPAAAVVPAALAGWNKYLSLHLHMMLMGYQVAVELDRGDFTIPISLFGRLRDLFHCTQFTAGVLPAEKTGSLLRRVFNYYPQTRSAVFDLDWQESERLDSAGTPWLVVEKTYRVRSGWRVLVNGREIDYSGGLEITLQPGDKMQIFPPGR